MSSTNASHNKKCVAPLEYSVLYTYYVQWRLYFSLSETNSWRKVCGENSAEYSKYLFTNAVIKWILNLCVSLLNLTTFWFEIKL